MLIVDCDEFTKTYYTEKYGVEDFTPIATEEVPHTCADASFKKNVMHLLWYFHKSMAWLSKAYELRKKGSPAPLSLMACCLHLSRPWL